MSECVCPTDPMDPDIGLCLGVSGESDECEACLVLDPEAGCLADASELDA